MEVRTGCYAMDLKSSIYKYLCRRVLNEELRVVFECLGKVAFKAKNHVKITSTQIYHCTSGKLVDKLYLYLIFVFAMHKGYRYVVRRHRCGNCPAVTYILTNDWEVVELFKPHEQARRVEYVVYEVDGSNITKLIHINARRGR